MTANWARGWVALDDVVCLEVISPGGRPVSAGFKATSLLGAMDGHHTTLDFSRALNYASVSEQVLYFGNIDRSRIRWPHEFSLQGFLNFLPARLFPEERRAIGSRRLADLGCNERRSFKLDMRWSPLGLLHRERKRTISNKIRSASDYFHPLGRSDLKDSGTGPPGDLADIPASVIAQKVVKFDMTEADWNKQKEERSQRAVSAWLKKLKERESIGSNQNDRSSAVVEDRSDTLDDLTSVMASVSI